MVSAVRLLLPIGLLLGSAGALPSRAVKAQAVKFQSELLFREKEVPNFPSCHAATIVELPTRDLLAAWYAGSHEKAKDVAILASRKSYQEEKWSTPVVIADTPDKSEGNPVLFVDPEHTVWLFYVTMYGNQWTQCKIKYKKSTDFGKTWRPEVVLREELGWMTRNKPSRLRSGDLLLPLYDETKWSSVFMRSLDGGQTWTHSGEILSALGNIQPTVVELSDGTLLAYMRTGGDGGSIWKSTSRDQGRSWGAAEKTALKNPNAAIDMVRLANGHLILAYNDSNVRRTPLTLALSEDEGKTWPCIRNLETESGEFSYPAIIQARDETVHVVYTYKRTSIKHVALNEAWIRADERARKK